MKVVGIIIGLVVLLGIASCGDDNDSASSADDAVIEAVSDSSSDTARVLELTTEGQQVASEITDLANEGSAAATALDMGRVCDIVDEMRPKVDRVAAITDELAAIESVPQSTINELRGNETKMRSVFAPAEEMC